MKTLKYIVISLLVVTVIFVALQLSGTLKPKAPSWTTETVSRGTITNTVAVSGVVSADDTAKLTFPTSGVITDVLVKAGDTVSEGQVLATLEQNQLLAERSEAFALLKIAEANHSELMKGPQTEVRDLTSSKVNTARAELERTKAEETEKVSNAYKTLLSTDLVAFPVDPTVDDTPPVISGTYTCDKEGIYQLKLYSSNANSSYSYYLTGLETGTYTVYTESPAPIGTCGLQIKFAFGETYAHKDWEIKIPNERSASYITNLNNYKLTVQQAKNRIEATEQALEIALRSQALENASPRTEATIRTSSQIEQAHARLQAIDARIEEKTLRAPFAGTISEVNIVRGETSPLKSAMILVADSHFEIKVRIPEIDITKLEVGQGADVIFDAKRDETIKATITFISPLATEIDGVAYFEAKLDFDSAPKWLRGGLNADINIIIGQKENVLRLPKRFVFDANGRKNVMTPRGETTATTTIDTGFSGNDGYVEVIGLPEGATVIAP